jgi:predicted MFS family arabinose efflux permease
MYVLVLQGGLALGSFAWGAVATHSSVKFALTVSASALACSLLLAPWYRFQQSGNLSN